MTAPSPAGGPGSGPDLAGLGRHPAAGRSIRQIAFHLEESLYYASAVGRLG
jgi:hypothetical protein